MLLRQKRRMTMPKVAGLAFLVGAVLLTVMAAGAGQRYLLAAPSAQTQTPVQIYLDPPSITVNRDTNDTFTMNIMASTGSQQVTAIQTFLDFNPAVLEVVDVDPARAGTQIQNGSTLTTVLENSADNSLGQVDYAAGKLDAPFPSGMLVLATITFRAKAPVASANITMSQQVPRDSYADHEGTPLASSLNGAVVEVLGQAPPIGTNQQVKVLINITNAQRVSGIQFNLGFDNTVAKIANVTGMTPQGYLPSFNDRQGNGPLTVSAAAFPPPGIANFSIAAVTFDLVGSPGSTTNLTWSGMAIGDGSIPPQPLGFAAPDGQITIGSTPSEITLTITVRDEATTPPQSGGSSGGGSQPTVPTPTRPPATATPPPPTIAPPAATLRTPAPPPAAVLPTPGAAISPGQSPNVAPTQAPAAPSGNAELLIAQIQGNQLPPAQAAEKLRELGTQDAAAVIRNTDPSIMAEIFGELGIQFTAELADEIGADKIADILSEIPPEEAAAVLALLDARGLAGVVAAMDGDALADLLLRLPPEKLFQIPSELLLDKLPQVPVEQLTAETPPRVDPNLPRTTAVKVATGITEYHIPKTSPGVWVELVGASEMFQRVVGKFTNELTDVTVQVKDLRYIPVDVPDFQLDLVVERYFQVEMENATNDDLSAVHMTIPVPKAWLESNNIHKWSVHLARYDEDLGRWVPFTAKRVQEDEENIIYTVVLPGLSLFAIAGTTRVPEPTFEVTDLSITPSMAAEDQEVQITAKVRNLDLSPVVYPANLWLNGTIEESRQVSLEPGGTATVSFTTTQSSGDYQVRMDRLSGQFSVSPATEAAAPPEGPAPITSGPPSGPSAQPAAEGDGVRIDTNLLIIIAVAIAVGASGITLGARYLLSSHRRS